MKKPDAPRLELPPQNPSLWTDLAPALKERVSESNFEIWLSSIRFLSADDLRLVLQVPNTFFQEYLAEHYTEVIQEEIFRKYNQRLKIEFTVISEPSTPAPATPSPTPTPKTPALLALLREENVSSIDQLEALEDRLLPELYQQRLDHAAERCTRYQGTALMGGVKVTGFNDARMAEEVAILKAQRLKEEAARVDFRKRRRALFSMCRTVEQLRQPGNPQSQRQYHQASHWETSGSLTRPEVKDYS